MPSLLDHCGAGCFEHPVGALLAALVVAGLEDCAVRLRDVEFDPRVVSLADERAANPVDRLPFAFGDRERTEFELVDTLALEIPIGQIAPEKRVSLLSGRHAAGLAERWKEDEGVVAPIPLFDGQDRHSAQVLGGRESSDRMEPLLDHLRDVLDLAASLFAGSVAHHQLDPRDRVDLVAVRKRRAQHTRRRGLRVLRPRARNGGRCDCARDREARPDSSEGFADHDRPTRTQILLSEVRPLRPEIPARFRPIHNNRRGSWRDTAGGSPRRNRIPVRDGSRS